MVYPKAFGQTVKQAFQAAYPGPAYLGLPCAPVIQTYDDVGPALVQAQIAEAARRGAEALSIYVVETASDEELEVVSWAKGRPPSDAELLVRLAVAYRAGALAILDHGTPAELAQWGALWSQRPFPAGALRDQPLPADLARRLDYLRGALRILDRGTPGELREWGALFARA